MPPKHPGISMLTPGALIILVLLLPACSVTQPAISTQAVVPVTSIAPASSGTPTHGASGLAPDNAATLASLEQVDDYPLYVMHYTGNYEYPLIGSQPSVFTGFSCSLFAALSGDGDRLYGRNFDWDYSPALLLYTDPPDGYASVSMVDLTFLGINSTAATSLIDLPLIKRTSLLAAPSMPFDGMNEYGLAIGMAAVPDEYLDDTSYDASRPRIGSIGIIRQILDHARTVDDAMKIFSQYNVDFTRGPPIHYLIADSSGKAILVEFYQKELVQLPNQDPWHLATNHLRCIAEGSGGCWRYNTLSEHLTTSGGKLDLASAMQLLSDVKQSSTQWSAVYNLSTGDVNVVIGQDYGTMHTFHLDLQLPCRLCP